MKEQIRAFICFRCGATAYTTDGSRPGCCTAPNPARTSGICGGHFVQSESSVDLDWIVNQEVEKRIAERMPSEEEMKVVSGNYSFQVPYDGTNNFYDKKAMKSFEDGYQWLLSRLTKPGAEPIQKTEGGTNDKG